MKFGLWYDFRCPPHLPLTWQETYAQTLEHIRYVEGLGYDDIWLSEHHFIEDGYLPSLLPVAAAGPGKPVTPRFQPPAEPIKLGSHL